MKIESIEIKIEHIPLKVPFVTALRRVETIEFVRVFVRCDDGSVGIGEAPATFAITGEDIEKILASIESIREALLGLTLRDGFSVLHMSSIGSSAKAALDIAFVTLEASAAKQSLAEYHKIEDLSPIKTDITISLNPTQQMLHDARVAFEASMDILKVKLGADIDAGIEVTELLWRELPDATLLIDANQAWTKEQTLLYLDSVSAGKIALIEQPVAASDLAALKEITNASATPILADEAAFTLEDVKQIVESKSADMINIKLMKCGGVSRAREILDYARAQGVRCMLGSMLEGPYSINAALYLAFAYRDVIEYVDLDSPLLYRELGDELDFFYSGATIFFRGFSGTSKPNIPNQSTCQ